MRSIVPSDRLAYLATPYTKYREGHAAAYMHAAQIAGRLIAAGINIFAPIPHGHVIAIHSGLDVLDAALWERLNLAVMGKCDILIVAHLSGWNESDGVAHEIKFFESAWRPIYDLNPETLTMKRRELGPPEHAESATA